METGESTEYEEKDINRKLEHIIRDYQTAWSRLQSQGQQVLLIRGWSVTVALAYMGFTVTARDKWADVSGFWEYMFVLYAPPALAILLFGFMEALTRSYAIFCRKRIIQDIDQIFYREGKSFSQAVKDHRFLVDKEDKEKRKDRWRRFFTGFLIAFGYWHAWLLIALFFASLLLGPHLRQPPSRQDLLRGSAREGTQNQRVLPEIRREGQASPDIQPTSLVSGDSPTAPVPE